MLRIRSKNIKAYWEVILLFLIVSTGCKKLIEADLPDDLVESGYVFSNDSLAMAALTGLYGNIMSQTKYFLNGGMTLYPGLSADELTRTSPLSNEDYFFNNSLLPTNQLVGNNIWKAAYSYLYQCNVSIEGLQNSPNVSPGLKKQLTAEAKFVRALCYYYLVNLFGEVPLAITPDAEINAQLPRARFESIIDQIKTDLLNAYTDLPDTVINIRPNKMACQALLARVYLYNKEWVNAEATATLVINSGRYQLVALNDVFIRTSAEVILQFAPIVVPINSAEGNMFVPPPIPNARPAYVITPSLQIAFESGDHRKDCWLKTMTINDTVGYTFPYKYKVNNLTPAKEYNVVLRLAELYLIRAEARARQTKTEEAVADVNVIRFRASLPDVSSSMGTEECLAAVEKERRTELFAEWGHRWFDLKRLNKVDTVLSVKNGWHITDQLYPIPSTEIERDHNLVQNEGY